MISTSANISGKRILFFVTEDWYFVSHRLSFARELVKLGADVAVGCSVGDKAKTIEKEGIRIFEVPFSRRRVAPHIVLRACYEVRRLIGEYAPDIVHMVALRPILIGWMATIGSKRRPTINAVAGLGSLFSNEVRTWRLWIAKAVVQLLFRRVFRHNQAYNVFQNREDLEEFVRHGFAVSERCHLIRGSGIEPDSWHPRAELASKNPVVLFVSRLLRDKGLYELLAASGLLRQRNVRHNVRIVGDCDECNPMSLSAEDMKQWHQSGVVEWLGPCTDVLEQMSNAHVIVFPSYREGLPRVLLEAGLAERAVIACDVVGCREVIADGANGILVPPRCPVALADAIERLLNDAELRRYLARRHRKTVCGEFSLRVVTGQFLALYTNALGLCGVPAEQSITAELTDLA